MTALPPLRDLPNHTRRRAELVDAISEPSRAARTRWLVPVAVAAAVAAVATGTVLLLGDLSDQAPAPPSASTPPPTSGSPTPSSSTPTTNPTLDPPPMHAMSAGEMSSALDDCFTGVAAEPLRPAFKAVVGYVVELDESAEPETPRGWLVLRNRSNPDDRIVCTKDEHGFGGWTRFGTEAASTYLTKPVVTESLGFGRYTSSIATITYAESESAPEIRAVLDRGYWFFPVPPGPSPDLVVRDGDTVRIEPNPDYHPLTVILRGYDADGSLIFDSSAVGDYEGCYSDPSGERIVDLNTAAPDVDPAECRRAYEWGFDS